MNKDQLNTAAEFLYYKRLLTEVAPTGILSLVADTNDFWATVTRVIPALKEIIMKRAGKLVVRPDSGDPVHILCGYEFEVVDNAHINYMPDCEAIYCSDTKKYYTVLDTTTEHSFRFEYELVELQECEVKGLVEVLWGTFGGTTTDKGFKMLDEHVGAIYGDAITLERQAQIGERLMAKGFVPQVVLGVGSYSFQFVTRDTHGSAMKATNVTKCKEKVQTSDGVSGYYGVYDQPIFKDPKTDAKKKSAKGLLRVEREEGELVQYDMQTRGQETQGELQLVFKDGELLVNQSLEDIRHVVASQL
tara:strand:+ start:1631 stop:2539 length:909 start_codon:yes stop_codon:yes gene_type:complete